jgi:hypothetical protein
MNSKENIEMVIDNDYLAFRDEITVDSTFKIVVWHNADFSNTKFELVQKLIGDYDGREHFQVRGSFRYANEFFKYLTNFSFGDI